ncbi:transporter substrate-binding domain-containing protein [bacterium]|nr:transporter substrate-binding domain-containing protein [bacterium]
MRRPALLAVLALLAPAAGAAQSAPPPTPLIVGVTDSRPLSYQNDDGVWTGLGVVVWEQIAAQVGLTYELRPIAMGDVTHALADHSIDAAIGAIPVTPEGEAVHDFSQPYLVTGLGFAQRQQDGMLWSALMRALLDPRLLTMVGGIIASVLVVGVLIALVERRSHSTDFGGSMRESVSMGVWWAAVTMTTVGYGDATPKTTTGRALALVWMFVGVVAVAFLTATVTSVLTLAHLRGAVEHPSDLLRMRLGVVDSGAGADYLGHRHVAYATYPTYEDALAALDRGSVDAVVGTLPVLRALVSQSWTGRLQVSPIVLEPLLYGVALPDGSPLLSRVNQALLAITHDDAWHDTEERFLGRR